MEYIDSLLLLLTAGVMEWSPMSATCNESEFGPDGSQVLNLQCRTDLELKKVLEEGICR